jgi:hypothetical protein
MRHIYLLDEIAGQSLIDMASARLLAGPIVI